MFKKTSSVVAKSQKGKKAVLKEFFAAVSLGHADDVKICIKRGVDINAIVPEQENFTALHMTAEKGDVELAKVLLYQKNLKLNAQTTRGNTPMMVAVVYNMVQFVRLLLKWGANPNIKNNSGKTALHIAVGKDYNLVNELLASKASPNVLDAFDNTPLSMAIIEHPSKAIAKCLLKNGADPNLRTMKGHSLLLELCLNRVTPEMLPLVKLLIEYGADPNIINSISKQTPLHMASITGSVSLAKLLIQMGANPNLRDLFGKTPFDVATEHGHEDLIAFYKHRKRSFIEPIDDHVSS